MRSVIAAVMMMMASGTGFGALPGLDAAGILHNGFSAAHHQGDYVSPWDGRHIPYSRLSMKGIR